VERILERRRLVALVREVTDPGEAVARHRQRQQPPVVPGDHGRDGKADDEAGADEVQAPVGAILVLAQVERIELRDAAVNFPLHLLVLVDLLHCSLLSRWRGIGTRALAFPAVLAQYTALA